MQKVIESSFSISHDASATVIITLLTFILGYIVTWSVFISNQYLNRKANRKMFIANLISLSKSLNKQESSFITIIDSLNLEQIGWLYLKVEFFQLQILKELTFKDSFKSFFHGIENKFPFCCRTNLKRKGFLKVFENLSKIEFWAEFGYKEFNTFLSNYNRNNDKRNETLEKMQVLWLTLFARINANELNEEELNFAKELNAITHRYSTISPTQRVLPLTTQETLIDPINQLYRKYHLLNIAKDIGLQALQVTTYFSEMKAILNHAKKQYTEICRVCRGIRRANDKITIILDNRS